MPIQKDVETSTTSFRVRTRLNSSRLPIRAREKPSAEQKEEAFSALNAPVTKKKAVSISKHAPCISGPS